MVQGLENQLMWGLAGHFQDLGFYSERARWEPEDMKEFCNCSFEYDLGYQLWVGGRHRSWDLKGDSI